MVRYLLVRGLRYMSVTTCRYDLSGKGTDWLLKCKMRGVKITLAVEMKAEKFEEYQH